ncbi:hypothetical protein PG984_002967 [Apiospora sp. TS-2023a]
MKLGNSWALHQDFAALFPRCPQLQEYTSSYVTTIVRLCEKAVVFTKKSTFKQFTASLTKSFEHEFSSLISELDQWGTLIEKRCFTLTAEHVLRSDQTALERARAVVHSVSSASKDQQRYLLKQAVLRSLLPDQNLFETQWRRQRRKGTCPWLLRLPKYEQWKQERKSGLLWLEGIIGSGKTVAMANIVADVSLTESCAYIFCSSKESQKARSIIGCIAYYLVRRVPTDDPLWEQAASKEDAGLMSISDIEDLILKACHVDDRIFIVIDALEECHPEEFGDVFQFLTGLMKQRKVLVCCLCRPESDCQRSFLRMVDSSERLYIRLDDAARSGEMEQFIEAEIERKASSRNLDQNLKAFIKTQLVAGAQGMYLWVSLQLEALFPGSSGTATNTDYIHDILCHLPANLPEAFDQALSRISNKRYGRKPFMLTTAAQRPLTLDEFRVALTVVPGKTRWNGAETLTDAKAIVYGCGGSLLEVDEEDQTVHFIHPSAMLHLESASSRDDTRTLHYDLDEAESYFAAVCITFLHYDIFDQTVSRKPRTISGAGATQRIIDNSSTNSQLWNRVARHLSRRSKGKSVADLDIGTSLYHMTEHSSWNSNFRTKFLPYAKAHWLNHTVTLNHESTTIWKLWTSILEGKLEHVQLPWNSTTVADLLMWAFKNSHHALILHFLRLRPSKGSDFVLLNQLAKQGNSIMSFKPEWLGDILAHVIYNCRANIQHAPLQFLLDVGADPNVPHRQLMRLPLELLVDTLPRASTIGDTSFMCNFLEHPTICQLIQGPLPSKLVAEALRKGFVDATLTMIDQFDVMTPTNQHRDSLLALAVESREPDVIGRLLERGFSPLASNTQNTTPLELALELQDWNILFSFLSWTKTNNPRQYEKMRLEGSFGIMYKTVVTGQLWPVNYLLEHGFNPSAGQEIRLKDDVAYETPQRLAIRLGRMGILRMLKTYSLDDHEESREALETTSSTPLLGQGNQYLMEMLLRSGGAPLVTDHGKRVSVALLACRELCSEPRELVQEAELTLQKHQTLDILLASLKNLSSPSDLDVLDCYGSAALHYAVRCQEGVEAILQRGADPNIRNAAGETPLLHAMQVFSTSLDSGILHSTMLPLLEHKANPESSPVERLSVMAMATRCRSTEPLKLLLDYGGDPNERLFRTAMAGPRGWELASHSLLDIALEAGNSATVELLRRYGAQDEQPDIPKSS